MNLKTSLAFAILCATAYGDDTPTDRERIRGSWKITHAVVNGKCDKDSLGTTIRFTTDQIIDETDASEEPTFFQLRRTKDTNEIDVLVDNGNDKPELVARGIYQLEDAKLRLCFAFDEKPFRLCILGVPVPPRPTDFDPKKRIKGYGKSVVILTTSDE